MFSVPQHGMQPFPEEGQKKEYNDRVNNKMKEILMKTGNTIFWANQHLTKYERRLCYVCSVLNNRVGSIAG